MTSRCGVVALVGAPNAGKSTLLNQAIGTKISIVTHKVQTTRTRIRGVALDGDSQIVFVDTPGIFKNPKRRLERAMVGAAWQAIEDADITVLLHDVNKDVIDEKTTELVSEIQTKTKKLVLALNKVDDVRPEMLLALVDKFKDLADFQQIFMISALKGDGVQDLVSFLAKEVSEGPWLYPEDQLSDLPMRLVAAEITREKLFLMLHQELPYSLAVETDSWEAFDNGSVKINQTIYVERDAQKKIAVGAGGKTIRTVREQSQKELEAMLDTKVHLFLFVKVRERWVDDPDRYREWGLDYNA
ncbi:GTPase Era [Rhodovibrionaceae bacterium A322]